MALQIAVSIINYRTADLTLACIRSVLADIGNLDVHIVVTDNASGDGSAEIISNWIDQQPQQVPVTLLRSPVNTGFSGGHNQGMAAIQADYYLPFNSDAVLRTGFLQNILNAAKADQKAGFFAPRIEFDDGTVQVSCFRFHSPLSELIRTARTNLVTRTFKKHEVAIGPNPNVSEIEWASFACILLSAKMVSQLGPMDEGYFLYYEDAEYCARGRRAGYRISYVPTAQAVHFRGGSGPVKSLASERKRLPKYYYASRTRFLYQIHGRTGLLAANVLWLVGRGIAQVTRLAGKKIKPMAKSEGRDIWINFFDPLGHSHKIETKK
jgi:N-acetylglucosaminyl-diphospho-decaprenol L-rhamnosyltransferase